LSATVPTGIPAGLGALTALGTPDGTAEVGLVNVTVFVELAPALATTPEPALWI
jgi:hypothetical protein